MILLANTAFPLFRFDVENKFLPSPDADETSIMSEDDGGAAERVKSFEKFQSQEEQDVAVFMSLAKKMDISSLIFILQGHAKAQNLPASAQAQAAIKISGKKAVKGPKQFRFAVANDDMVKCVYHVVASVKENTDMWWSDVEMKQIRGAAIQDVKYYRKYRSDFKQTVELLANAGVTNDGAFSEATIQANMKKLMEDSYARGLEVHIVNLLSDLRKETVRAVLEEQAECRMSGDSPDVTAESLREQSMAYTIQSRTFALKLAQCDQVEALKATLSSQWGDKDSTSGNMMIATTPTPVSSDDPSACSA
jgi:hypothetical protein